METGSQVDNELLVAYSFFGFGFYSTATQSGRLKTTENLFSHSPGSYK